MNEDKVRETIDRLIAYAESTGRIQLAQMLRCAAVASGDELLAEMMIDHVAPVMLYMQQLMKVRNN